MGVLVISHPLDSHALSMNEVYERAIEAESRQKQMALDITIMYKMLHKLYREKFTQKEYEKLIWGEKKDD